ncbi:MAG: YidC/Oxa1 family membrane protein insertase, partial [Clostridia bacterium]|nr:YidC/Oxa1 family membrane protein insertase [Clostridia bacterium]
MESLFSIINQPLSWVLRLFSELPGHSFALSVAVFTLLINVILLPLSIKSQKSSVQQMRIKPKLDELKKKYGNDR